MSLRTRIDQGFARLAAAINAVDAKTGGGSGRHMVQISNADISQNLNDTNAVEVFFGATDKIIGSDVSIQPVFGSRLIGSRAGTVQVNASIGGRDAIARASWDIRLTRNGVAFGPIFNQSYVRNSNAQTESGSVIPGYIFDVAANDQIGVQSVRTGQAGIINPTNVGSVWMNMAYID